MDNTIWNNLCDAVKNNKNMPEIPFEKSVANDFLNALDWNKLKGNLKEQFIINQHTRWRADFALFVPGNSNPEIMVELKKPSNKQNKKDRAQVSDYLKITDCRFGLYFGEKLELFFLEYKEDKRETKSILTVEYEKDSPYYGELLKLLRSNTYDRDLLVNFCVEQLAIQEACDFWTKKENSDILLRYMMEYSELKPELYSRFCNIMEIRVSNKNKKAFDANNKEKINAVLQLISSKSKGLNKQLTDASIQVSKPRFQFWMAGLKDGDTIIFEPANIKVKVASKNKIEYNGSLYTLSGFCREYMPEAMRHGQDTYEGPSFFTYKGISLKKLREEIESSNNN